MQRTEISQLYRSPAEYAGREITVCGWVKTVRDSKNVGFLQISDGSVFKGLQVVFEEAKLPNYRDIRSLNVGAAVVVRGTLVLTPEAAQPFEVNAAQVDIEGASTAD
ncbi:MAG TPA: OB-fold nucleic acid binding domain-containing protein, partial [Clostridiales bacterium]|nr:OB-fold nucleic acid binding domain-containing protein [Clostridiales bacterium]